LSPHVLLILKLLRCTKTVLCTAAAAETFPAMPKFSLDYTFFTAVTPIFGAGADGAVFCDTANTTILHYRSLKIKSPILGTKLPNCTYTQGVNYYLLTNVNVYILYVFQNACLQLILRTFINSKSHTVNHSACKKRCLLTNRSAIKLNKYPEPAPIDLACATVRYARLSWISEFSWYLH